MRLSVAATVLALGGYATFGAAECTVRGEPREPPASAGIVERFLSRDDPALASYRALRTLEAVARGGRMRARLTAWTTLDPADGFNYWVVEESGSGLIRKKVLRAALEAERTIRSTGQARSAELTPNNYDFSTASQIERGLVRIDIRPKRRHPMLVEGSILLTEPDGDLQQVEGTLSRRPSFWTREVHIVRRYERISGVRVPVAMESTAHVIAAGTSTFSMVYEYAAINGEAQGTQARGDPNARR
ncbi:MAG: hypothetical protein AB7J63_12090 [Vicinamibacterales bacterium]